MNSLNVAQYQDINAKFKLGMTRLEAAELNQSALEQALLSFHGALEDYIRLALSEKPAISAETRAAVCDRSKIQWRDLADLAQSYKIITANNKYFILGMNKKRQAIAHGKACELSKQEVVQYAKLIKSLIGYQEPVSTDSFTPSPPVSPQPGVIHKSSSSRLYNVAIGIASVVLVVMVIGVIVVLVHPKNSSSATAIRTTPESACVIKGNISISSGVRYYHLPGMEDYAVTVITPDKGERWFCTEAEAIAQGWRKAPR